MKTERIADHLRAGRITVDGEIAHELEPPAPERIVFH
jgi:hypothetical protein